VIRVNLIATFRLIAGIKTFEIKVSPEDTVQSIIGQIIELLPVLRTHWLDAGGELYAHVHVFWNGEDVSTLPAGLKTCLNPGDILDFFPPVAGG
jgi:MoaD family protein